MGVAYLPLPLAKFLYKFFETILPTSRYMFFLDIDPEEAFKRLQSRDHQEVFENLQDLIKVRKKALKLAQKWYIINANESIENIQKQINTTLDLGK